MNLVAVMEEEGFYVRRRVMSAPLARRGRASFGAAAPIELPTPREMERFAEGCAAACPPRSRVPGQPRAGRSALPAARAHRSGRAPRARADARPAAQAARHAEEAGQPGVLLHRGRRHGAGARGARPWRRALAWRATGGVRILCCACRSHSRSQPLSEAQLRSRCEPLRRARGGARSAAWARCRTRARCCSWATTRRTRWTWAFWWRRWSRSAASCRAASHTRPSSGCVSPAPPPRARPARPRAPPAPVRVLGRAGAASRRPAGRCSRPARRARRASTATRRRRTSRTSKPS